MKIHRTILFSLLTLVASLFNCQLIHAGGLKGEKCLGIMAGYASYNTSGYAGINFQYTIVPHLRVAPEIAYIFRHHDTSGLEVSVDLQFPFRVAKAINIYPIAGAAFSSWNYHFDGSSNRFGGNVGAGIEFYLTSNLKISAQAKYMIVGKTNSAFAGVGMGYIF